MRGTRDSPYRPLRTLIRERTAATPERVAHYVSPVRKGQVEVDSTIPQPFPPHHGPLPDLDIHIRRVVDRFLPFSTTVDRPGDTIASRCISEPWRSPCPSRTTRSVAPFLARTSCRHG
ncbi:hypothetical protein RHA1_ro05729 [Rhodococcus jostii RHA1]|uniref:Uncharacterized protein n=1 Tax=Rhodococcus jostii (strain RHA1) TaxID=101510 RepID=Q0S4M9_RHOJR|nr:hypothetical protein RHA1_ro05729 [Rhodococcus jostii RHA1]